MSWHRADLLVATVLLAACSRSRETTIEAVIVAARPLSTHVELLSLTVQRLDGEREITVFGEMRPAVYDGDELRAWTTDVHPESAGDPGVVLYRFRAEAIAAGRAFVATQSRLVFVPGALVVLPLRLEPACVDRACAATETCVESGGCSDDFVPACSLVRGTPPDFCRRGLDASADALPDAPDDASPDAPVDASPDAPIDAGLDARSAPDAAADAAACPDPSGDAGSSGVSWIAAGARHACASGPSGTYCWGDNASGQLGDGTFEAHAAPRRVVGIDDSRIVVAGWDHTCAYASTAAPLLCWGKNLTWQLGLDVGEQSAVPVALDLMGTVRIASAGAAHTCAIVTPSATPAANRLYCWGNNEHGQLGSGMPLATRLFPRWLSTTSAAYVSAGGLHTCAFVEPFALDCWGDNRSGELGDGTRMQRDTPTAVPGVATPGELAIVSAGASMTCADVVELGGIACWGANGAGRLGYGTAESSWVPRAVVGLPADVHDVVAAFDHTCARSDSGRLYCWGANDHGQLGDGTMTDRPSPVAVSGISDALDVAVGNAFTCATTAGGRVLCWGVNDAGQIGRPASCGTDFLLPVPVPMPGAS